MSASSLLRRTRAAAAIPLTRFASALTTIGSAPVNVLLVGDSIFEFQSESSEANRVFSHFRNLMQAHYGGAGGAGYYPVGRLTSPQVCTYGAQGAAPGTLNSTYGLGAKCEVLHDSTEWVQIVSPTACDRFQILFTKGPGLGIAGIQLDGGSVSTFDTSGGSENQSGHAVYDSGNLGAAATHTIKVLGNTGVVVPEGWFFENGDHSSGIHMWEAADSGQKADYMTAGVTGTEHWHSLVAAPPDLVIIEFLLNEQAQAIDPAVFRANLGVDHAAADVCRGAQERRPIGRVVRIGPPWVAPAPHAEQQEARRCAGGEGCDGVLERDYAEFGWIGADPGGLTVDGAHPSDVGSLALATFMRDRIVAMVGS